MGAVTQIFMCHKTKAYGFRLPDEKATTDIFERPIVRPLIVVIGRPRPTTVCRLVRCLGRQRFQNCHCDENYHIDDNSGSGKPGNIKDLY